ncbi:MAG: acyl-CoA dehydrogenase [Sulfobacillus acidophilus]|uniref:Acyl-CoA dehydrogenase n=1 Tax=Sulfobacillus acidophilus TaxID=53633 RepID=A0A2T2WNV3_9FIRM|nr:MAG: acyl-CoA dehydrogenase [Sulfobacillus acidophilus]
MTHTEEQAAMLNTVDKIADRFGHTYWLEHARAGTFPKKLWAELSQAGVMGLALPERYGGSGLGLFEMALVQERLAERGVPLLLMVVGPGLSLMIMARHGSQSLKERFLPQAAQGRKIFCFGITEPNAGSNTLKISTTATARHGEWIVTGSKHFVSGADQADYMLVVSRTAPYQAGRHDTLTLFVVDMTDPRVRLRKQPMHLLTAEHQFEVVFDDVIVPDADRIGEVGEGFRYLFDGLNPERINVAALAIGMGRRLLDAAVGYASQRQVFSYPIGAHQAIQHALAEAKIHLELANLMNHYAAKCYDRQEDAGGWANMAKVGAVDAALEAADIAIEVHGGNAFTEDYDLLSQWELCRLFKTAPVARELALNYVGEHVLGLPRSR